MTATRARPSRAYPHREYTDFAHAGPGTLGGRYLRMFWQPVYHSEDLPPGHAKPIVVMGEEFTLYRGEEGTPHLVASRCAHRGMQLSPGWVEGDCIRCFYHGWVYDGSGQCVEQPAEPEPFCEKVRIPGYPVRDYLGLVFAYLGDDEPPPFPRYPDFEDPECYLEMDSYFRGCNYFNNLENSLDTTHVGFVHRGTAGSWDGTKSNPTIEAKESRWGITNYTKLPDGTTNIAQFGMPNIYHAKVLPIEPEVLGFREFIVWWTPLDDESHMQFTVNKVRLPREKMGQYTESRAQRLAQRTVPKEELAEAILAGKMRLEDVDPASTDIIRLQDDVAQIGQRVIADRKTDHLGRGDSGVILIRKLWTQELRALSEGRPLKQWSYDVEELPVMRDGQ